MNLNMKNIMSDIVKKSNKKQRICMFSNCKEKAIKSHVLQKNGIISQVSNDNHVIQLECNLISVSLDLKRIGVNNAYTFYGFCSKHDTEVFLPIEKELDFTKKQHQILFCYRGLCQEIRRKEIAFEWLDKICNIIVLEKEIKRNFNIMKDGFEDGIKNLSFYKTQIEESLKDDIYDKFFLDFIEIPKIEICLSISLNIGTFKNEQNLEYSEFRKTVSIFPTSFINIIPLQEKNVVIFGYHKDYPCLWTEDLLKKMKNGSKKFIFKELSDLIVLRTEFWLMSEELLKKIPEKDISEYKNIFKENTFDHREDLKTSLNIFEYIE